MASISLDTTDYDREVGNVTKSGEALGSKLKTGLSKAGQMAAKGIGLITGAAAAAGGALLALEANTEEYRVAQGKLNTAFEAAGYGADTAKQAYTDFYKILGDTDTATEASQLLAKLSENEQDMTTWTRTAAGVWGTFGDSLPIEGLIESSNETAKVGQVTGVLADALNWAGISEDDFNAKLAACSSESERNKLIMDTLSSTYDDAADAFYKNNDAVIKSRDAQAKMQDSIAKVGDAVSRVKNAFLEQFTPVIEEAATKAADFISGINPEDVVSKMQSMISAFQKLLPVITGVTAATLAYKAAMAISGIITAVTKATQGATGAQAALNVVMSANPFVLVATLIAGLVTAIITLWATNEDFRNALIGIWEGIKQTFSDAWTAIQGVWQAVAPYFQNIWNSIQNTFSVVASVLSGFFSAAWSAIQAVWNTVTGFFQGVWSGIQAIFAVVEAVLSGDFQAARNAIENIWNGITDFFSGIWEDIKNVFSDAWDSFKNIGKKIVDALKSGIKSAWDGLTGWFNSLWDGLFGNRTANVTVNRKVVDSVDGSHASGLSYVPFDGYLAELHRGEMVLTRTQAMQYRRVGTNESAAGNVNIGQAAAAIVNAINRSNNNTGTYTFNLVLPDGKKLASYMLKPLADYARANGTPIIKPM